MIQNRSRSRNWGTAARADPGRWKVPFLAVWGGQAFSLVGSALVRFALIWWLTERAGSATTFAVAALLSKLPTIAPGPFVGALIDRPSVLYIEDRAHA